MDVTTVMDVTTFIHELLEYLKVYVNPLRMKHEGDRSA